MILLIDNYDSFTYNIYHYVASEGIDVQVHRNDELSLDTISKLNPDAIIISPGPGTPVEAGISMEIIQAFYKKIPILGVCLGHQAIASAFGAKINQATLIKHGKSSLITHNGEGIFSYLSQPLEVMRYHSLIVERTTLPPELTVVATSLEDNEVMAIKHNQFPVFGIQFHPESIGTATGKKMIRNFLEEIGKGFRHETIS